MIRQNDSIVAHNINSLLDKELNDNFKKKIDVYVKKRSSRKYITTIYGLDSYPKINLKKFIKYIKTNHGCIGTYNKKDNSVTFSGDQRDVIINVLIKCGIENDDIIKHGL